MQQHFKIYIFIKNEIRSDVENRGNLSWNTDNYVLGQGNSEITYLYFFYLNSVTVKST